MRLLMFYGHEWWYRTAAKSLDAALHSFNHLGQSKAPADFAQSLLNDVVARLEQAEFSVMVTPFGYFNEFRMHVDGASLAKVFKEF